MDQDSGCETVKLSDDEWRHRLSAEQFEVLREGRTEPAFGGRFLSHDEDGVYTCAGCGHVLFSSETKFESNTGWPSFRQPLESATTSKNEDVRPGMRHVEVVCSRCDSHLGHVFEDADSGPRYCINSVSLSFEANAAHPAPTG